MNQLIIMLSAIVLAAGLSKRMGSVNKLLLTYKNKTVTETVVENILAAGIEEVIVVTGHQSGMVEDVLKKIPVTTVHNPYYEKGMTTSIQAGLQYATGSGYMICLSDMVLLKPEDYSTLKTAFEQQVQVNENCICIPIFNSQKGNPVIFSSFYQQLILENEYMDGCKNIVTAYKENVHLVQMNTSNILADIDYPEDYKKLNGFTGSQ
ncbi:MAG: nucleotidyltransferase family protein [Panacibacter sp.]